MSLKTALEAVKKAKSSNTTQSWGQQIINDLKAEAKKQSLSPVNSQTYYTSSSSYNPSQQSSRLGNEYSNLANSEMQGQIDALRRAAGGVGGGTSAIDLSGIIADYQRNNQEAVNILNKTLSDTINTLKTSNEQSRNDLLTSLKRFQEANAESMRTQQQDYNSARSTLEDESFMNQRGTVANAAARGLGGSGLQQLAQLQNRLAAGKNVSALAQKNQTAQDALRRALAQEQEDYDTKVSNLNKNLEQTIINAQNQTAAKINEANSATTNIINELIYNEQVRQANARASASNAAANLEAQIAALQGDYDSRIGSLKSFENSVEQQLKNASSKKEAEQILNDSLASLFQTDYGLSSSYKDLANQRLNNLYNLYSNYYKK